MPLVLAAMALAALPRVAAARSLGLFGQAGDAPASIVAPAGGSASFRLSVEEPFAFEASRAPFGARGYRIALDTSATAPAPAEADVLARLMVEAYLYRAVVLPWIEGRGRAPLDPSAARVLGLRSPPPTLDAATLRGLRMRARSASPALRDHLDAMGRRMAAVRLQVPPAPRRPADTANALAARLRDVRRGLAAVRIHEEGRARLALVIAARDGRARLAGAWAPATRFRFVDPLRPERPEEGAARAGLQSLYAVPSRELFLVGREDADPVPARVTLVPELDDVLARAAMALLEVTRELAADQVTVAGNEPAHPFVRVGPGSFSRGAGSGVQVDPAGALRLAPGATRGAWMSPFAPLPPDSNAFLVGTQARVSPTSGVKVWARWRSPDGRTTEWRQMPLEAEVRFDDPQSFVQFVAMIMAATGGGSPRVGGVTVTSGFVPPGSGGTFGQGPGRGRGNRNRNRNRNRNGNRTRPRRPPARPSGPAVAPGSGGAPRVISRREWNARPPRGGWSDHTPRELVVHHTAAPARQYRGASTVQGVQRFHQGTRGWSDIGYHFLIGPDGKIFEGRPAGKLGAHVIPNTGKLGISLIGNYENDVPSAAMFRSLVQLLTWLRRRYSIPASRRVTGHRDHMSTACPGRNVYRRMGEIQNSSR